MGRPRTFDTAEAVTAATATFTRYGFEGTSVDRLVDATGVHRASLYGIFGSKHGLFLACLDALMAPLDDHALDLVLVALLERGTDPAVHQRLVRLVGHLGDDPAPVLGARLLTRAQISVQEEK